MLLLDSCSEDTFQTGKAHLGTLIEETFVDWRDRFYNGGQNFVRVTKLSAFERLQQRQVELLHERALHHVRLRGLAKLLQNARHSLEVNVRRRSREDLQHELDSLDRLCHKSRNKRFDRECSLAWALALGFGWRLFVHERCSLQVAVIRIVSFCQLCAFNLRERQGNPGLLNLVELLADF